jgi:hypothetical protein
MEFKAENSRRKPEILGHAYAILQAQVIALSQFQFLEPECAVERYRFGIPGPGLKSYQSDTGRSRSRFQPGYQCRSNPLAALAWMNGQQNQMSLVVFVFHDCKARQLTALPHNNDIR